jgi:hypothetical protein
MATQAIETLSASQQAAVQLGIGLDTAPRLIFAEDFTGASYNTAVIKSFNAATLTFDAANDRLQVDITNNARGVLLDEATLGLVDGQWYVIEARWTGSASMQIISAWSDALSPRSSHANPSFPAIHLHRQSAAGSGGNFSPIINGRNLTGTLTWYLTSVRVWAVTGEPTFTKGTQSAIVIGAGLTTDGNLQDAVVIGNDITAAGVQANDVLIGPDIIGSTGSSTLANVAIGSGADISTISGGNTNPARVAVGNLAQARSWRATAIGSHARALATSATVVGNGSVSEKTHGDVFGRGGFLPAAFGSSDVTVLANKEVYLSNPFHRCDLPPSGISIGESDGTVTPSSVECAIHGKDALDIRATPSDTNIAGGHLALVAGRGTGTGIGGELRFRTAPAGSSGAAQNALVTAMQLDAVATGGGEETRFLLLDLTDGTLKRVSFGADDSAGTGFKVLRVAN